MRVLGRGRPHECRCRVPDRRARIARACPRRNGGLEALMLQRTGLRDTLFIAMSNYYYEEKNKYLEALAKVRADEHDLTEFLKFGLRGVTLQCNRLLTSLSSLFIRHRNWLADSIPVSVASLYRDLLMRQALSGLLRQAVIGTMPSPINPIFPPARNMTHSLRIAN
jgi:hypothetical protein